MSVPEDMNAIKVKIKQLINSITDSLEVKNTKQLFATTFNTVKKSEALRDNVSSRAFKRVRWTNLGWGALSALFWEMFLGHLFHQLQRFHHNKCKIN